MARISSQKPVVVHLVDLVDQDETGLRIVVGGGHNDIPQLAGRQGLVDFAGDLPQLVENHPFLVGPVGPNHQLRVVERYAIQLHLFGGVGEDKRPGSIFLHRLDEVFGDEQGEVELTQAAIFPLGLNELDHIGMTDIHGTHLGTTTTTGRRDGETHLVIDIHEGERTRGIGTGTGDKSTARTKGREVIANAAAGLQGQACLMDLAEDIVHRIFDGTGDSAVDGRGRRLVFEGPRVGGDAASRNGTIAQRPQERFIPGRRILLLFGQGSGHSLVGVIDAAIDGHAILAFEAILAIPDFERGLLQGDKARAGFTRQYRFGFSHIQSTLYECI